MGIRVSHGPSFAQYTVLLLPCAFYLLTVFVYIHHFNPIQLCKLNPSTLASVNLTVPESVKNLSSEGMFIDMKTRDIYPSWSTTINLTVKLNPSTLGQIEYKPNERLITYGYV